MAISSIATSAGRTRDRIIRVGRRITRVEFDITPVGKPRQTQRDKWNPSEAVLRYRAFADELRLKANLKRYTPSDQIDIVFHIPMPASWSNKQRDAMRTKPHQQKPDLDNLIKAFLDPLLKDDSIVWAVTAQKRWADRGAIVVFTPDGEGVSE